MLSISVAVGLIQQPNGGAGFAAAGLSGATIAGATLFGRRIRKNASLQALLSAVVGGLSGLIAVAGGGSLLEATTLALALAAAFVAGVASVRTVLERRCRRARRARFWSIASVSLPIGLAVLLFLTVGTKEGLALGLVGAYAIVLLAWRPDARRLKHVGISLAATQLLVGLLLVI